MRQELTVQLQVYTIQINRFAGNSPIYSNSSLLGQDHKKMNFFWLLKKGANFG